MTLIISLLVAGVLLVAAEVLMPSGVIASLGGLCLVGGVVLVAGAYGLFPALATGVGAALATGIVVYLELRLLPRTRVGKRMYNEAASSGKAVDTGASTAVELVGKTGRALTTCAPTGMVEIEGRQYEAASLDGLLHVGDALVVAGRDTYKLLVKKQPAGGITA